MSAALHLAKPEDLDKVLTLVTAFHEEMEIPSTEDSRRAAIEPLLNGIPYGAVYLAGPTRAPIGYIVVTFSWSIEFGGMDGSIDELYIRPPVRKRGIATEILLALPKTLAEAGITSLHLEVDREDESTQRLYAKSRFKARDRYILMTKEL